MHRIIKPLFTLCLVLLAASLLSQCSYYSTQPLEQLAKKHQLKTMLFNESDIPLKGLVNHSSKPNSVVFIYFEGDGRPWEPYRPTTNPNTQQPVSLPLMINGQRDALYLFRPCYGWQHMPQPCGSNLWTSARYSQKVVNYLSQAIEEHKRQYAVEHYILVGHSGGATLALLLGAQRSDVLAVVSIAGNLNHQRWTEYFSYLPLEQSINLPSRDHFPEKQYHWYLIGEKDTIVPAFLQTDSIEISSYNKIKKYRDFTHHCCWNEIWPAFLSELETTLSLK